MSVTQSTIYFETVKLAISMSVFDGYFPGWTIVIHVY